MQCMVGFSMGTQLCTSSHPFVRKGTMRYRELMLVHLDRTALLNSSSCTWILGSLLLRLASTMAVATAVKITAPVPMTMGLLKRAMTAVQGRLLLLLVCLLGLGRQLAALPKNALCFSWLPGKFTWNMLQQVRPLAPGQQVGVGTSYTRCVHIGLGICLDRCDVPEVSTKPYQ